MWVVLNPGFVRDHHSLEPNDDVGRDYWANFVIANSSWCLDRNQRTDGLTSPFLAQCYWVKTTVSPSRWAEKVPS